MNDIILKVNNAPANVLQHKELVQFFRASGETLNVLIRYGHIPLEVEILKGSAGCVLHQWLALELVPGCGDGPLTRVNVSGQSRCPRVRAVCCEQSRRMNMPFWMPCAVCVCMRTRSDARAPTGTQGGVPADQN